MLFCDKLYAFLLKKLKGVMKSVVLITYII
jgi:hypothetical protein